ncbi:MAG TPA: methyltransferase domain-containing protein [Bacteroidia bacterium]|nr:methyltransferase domain-containing protein [Bacteroidia bacterium]
MGPGKRKDAVTRLVFDALSFLMQGNDRADLILNNLFRVNKVTDEIVRRETAKVFYGLIRFWRPLTSAIRLGEVLFPADAERLVDAYQMWIDLYQGKPASPFVPGGQVNVQLEDKLRKYLRVRKIRESLSDWLDETGVKELGEAKWEETIHFLNMEPRVFLRTNTALISAGDLARQLNEEGIDVHEVEDLPGALLLGEFRNVFALKAYNDGLFEVQDRSSQETALFCKVKSGMVVIDACAGAGGKTLHLASLMKNSGKIHALDTQGGKLKTLRERCSKAKTDIVETKEITSEDIIKSYAGKADIVLLDVPCTGSGVLRRNPDAKWRMDEEDLTRLHELQKHILEQYSVMVKTGGTLVYSTCSVFPSEGEEQATWFSALKSGEWELEEQKRTGIDKNLGDGFFMARWRKK